MFNVSIFFFNNLCCALRQQIFHFQNASSLKYFNFSVGRPKLSYTYTYAAINLKFYLLIIMKLLVIKLSKKSRSTFFEVMNALNKEALILLTAKL
jgi:hypothetical protein